jgi:hypothetical protein
MEDTRTLLSYQRRSLFLNTDGQADFSRMKRGKDLFDHSVPPPPLHGHCSAYIRWIPLFLCTRKAQKKRNETPCPTHFTWVSDSHDARR